ncbi:SRA stem-loop-interacting RNA-binding protein, mitochondrial-like [Moschus berezovskii]|uniref:RRM domain-containing protein n=1 Tax=Moschus moschiferus TaxID=68415 RepID=A0A8C6E561_MOSMO|nr:SRA stem-loop-interacting RNA-binding protein, mitochondrial-like [Moschus berezovskii]
MVSWAVRGAMELPTDIEHQPVHCICQKNSLDHLSELRGYFVQFGHVGKCTVPFDKEIDFHRGMDCIQFSSEEELHNTLPQENHVTDGVELHVQAQKPKDLQGDQTSDEEKDF